MASIAAQAFRDRLALALPAHDGEMLDAAPGSGPEHRELQRALMLGDRAARHWAGAAIAAERSTAPNDFGN